MAHRNIPALALLLVICEVCDEESQAAPGSQCSMSRDCGESESCYDGFCQCDLGSVIRGAKCQPAPSLREVSDTGVSTTSASASYSTSLTTMVPGLRGGNCEDAAESRPVRFEIGDNAHYFAPYQNAGPVPTLSWADQNVSTGWFGPLIIPAFDANGSVVGDGWATSSQYSGMGYVSEIYRPVTDLGTCIGVAAITSTDIINNTWERPVSCLTDVNGDLCDGVDGPMLEADPSGTAMYAVARMIDRAPGCVPPTGMNCDNGCSRGTRDDGLVIEIMANCRFGPAGCCGDGVCSSATTCVASGPEQCPVTARFETAAFSIDNHPAVAVNPCSHRAIVVYGTTDDTVSMLVMKPDGNAQMTKQLASGVDVGGQNNSCAGLHGEVVACTSDTGTTCGDTTESTGQCVNVARKPQIAVTSTGGRCYAGVTFAYTTGGTGNPFRVRRQVWDVTDDSSPTSVLNIRDSADTNSYNQFSPEVVAAGPWIGFGYYSSELGPCSVQFSANIVNVLTSSKDFFVPNIDDHTFPVFGSSQSGIDYQSGLNSPDARGMVFGWNSSVCAPANAKLCAENCILGFQGCTSGNWGRDLRLGLVVPL